MDFTKIKRLVNKISDFIDSLEKGESEILPIEKELLKGYALELYKTIGNDSIEEDSTLPNHQDISVPEVAQSKQKEEVEIKKKPKPLKKEPKVAIKVPVIKAPKSEPENELKSKAIIFPNEGPIDFDQLFNDTKGTDVSHKLSRSSLSDLKTAMGINEKIFTINELFAGNASLFNTTVDELHKFDSMAKAKTYLISGIAKDQNWVDGKKLKKAVNFIKLVERLYN